ncbi:MAG: flagellar export protein FliJ [Candidatus Poribacteria bacterium]|nr:flagellar export protein FliJ [Candidatus Poribacteria bacterium]
MKKYRFNLEAVLQQRKLIHEQKAREFSAAMHQLQVEARRLSEFRCQQSETLSAFRKKKQDGLTVRDSVLYLPYLDRLAEAEKAQAAVVAEVETRVKAAGKALEHARVQYEIMEKMKEKSRQTYNDQLKHEENRFLDEISTMRYESAPKSNG